MDAIERRRRISAEAADWWALLQSGEVPRAQRGQYVQWLSESHVHVTEMLRLVQVDGALESYARWADLPRDLDHEGASVVSFAASLRKAADTPRSRIRLATLAACGLFVVATVLWFQWTVRGQTIATERGERREVVLEDGTVVQVDPQTSMQVKFAKGARDIRLQQGRAVFRVARQVQRPFTVHVDDASVRALGTAFGVDRRGPDRIIVTVVEGKVAVSSHDVAPTTLEPNQQVTVDKATMTPARAVDTAEALAWSQGKLIFKDESVARVAEEFNRYNRLQLKIEDGALAGRRISGTFDAAYPEEFVAFVEGSVPVEIVRVEGRSITIAPKKVR